MTGVQGSDGGWLSNVSRFLGISSDEVEEAPEVGVDAEQAPEEQPEMVLTRRGRRRVNRDTQREALARHNASPGAGLQQLQLNQQLEARSAPGPDLNRDWSRASQEDLRGLQSHLNTQQGEALVEDGVWGPATEAALERARTSPLDLSRDDWSSASSGEVQRLQRHLNATTDAGLAVDGVWGPNTSSALEGARPASAPARSTVEPGAADAPDLDLDYSNAPRPEVRRLQDFLQRRGHDVDVDGVWGPQTRGALEVERQGPPDQPPNDFDGRRASRAEVLNAQRWMASEGYDVDADGVWGPQSDAAWEAHIEATLPPDERPVRVGEHGDAMVVVYPDYDIKLPDWAANTLETFGVERDKMALGHADIITWSDEEGGQVRPTLHQFGRYSSDEGNVRTKRLPITLDVDPETKDLTPESRQRLLAYLSENHGHGGRIEAAEIENVDLDRLNSFVRERTADHEAYDVLSNNCTSFAWEAAASGAFVEREARALDGRGRYQMPSHSMWGAGRVADRYSWAPPE